MDCRRLVYLIVFTCIAADTGHGQQLVSGSVTTPQAAALLSQSASALAGPTPLADVTLIGTAESIIGSEDETGAVSLKATASGQSRIDLSLSDGNHSEVRSLDASDNLVGSWSGPDGVQHPISYHNLLTDSSWFFPALTMRRLAAVSGLVATYIGPETLNGQSVLHASFLQPAAETGANAATIQHLTQIDAYFDTATFLPVALSFVAHPDGNELIDIPVQIFFSNYQSVNGVQAPYRVQKMLNGTLVLDVHLQSVVLNSGLSASAFAVQPAQ